MIKRLIKNEEEAAICQVFYILDEMLAPITLK